jgi:hypothetical protein
MSKEEVKNLVGHIRQDNYKEAKEDLAKIIQDKQTLRQTAAEEEAKGQCEAQ